MFAMGRRVEESPIRVRWDAVKISIWALLLGWLVKTLFLIVWTILRSQVAMTVLAVAVGTLILCDGAGVVPVAVGYGLGLLLLVWLRWKHPLVFERWVYLGLRARWRRFAGTVPVAGVDGHRRTEPHRGGMQ